MNSTVSKDWLTVPGIIPRSQTSRPHGRHGPPPDPSLGLNFEKIRTFRVCGGP